MKKIIYYIETTLNGYIIKKVPICEYIKGKDYCGLLDFNLDGEEVEYYNDIAGDWEELDLFLETGNTLACREYDNHLDVKTNVYLEYWRTDNLGWFDDRYNGIMIDLEKHKGSVK